MNLELTLPADWLPAAERLALTLLHSLWQIGVLAAAAALLLRWRPALPSSARYRILMALLLLAPVSLLLTWYLLAPAAAPASSGTTVVHFTLPDLAELDLTADDRAEPSPAGTGWLPLAVASLYAAGLLAMLVRLALGWVGMYRLQHAGLSPVPDDVHRRFRQLVHRMGLRRTPAVWASTRTLTPLALGLLKPTVLLPLGLWAGLAPQHLDAILLHELAHLRRGDTWANLLQLLAETLCFYHPMAWWLSRQVRTAREHCCDDLAAAALHSPQQYAHALVALAELNPQRRITASSLSPTLNNPYPMYADRNDLMGRIRRLFGAHTPPTRSQGRAPAILLVALTAGICLIGWAQTVPPPPPPGRPAAPAEPASPSRAALASTPGVPASPTQIQAPEAPEAPGAAAVPLAADDEQDTARRRSSTSPEQDARMAELQAEMSQLSRRMAELGAEIGRRATAEAFVALSEARVEMEASLAEAREELDAERSGRKRNRAEQERRMRETERRAEAARKEAERRVQRATESELQAEMSELSAEMGRLGEQMGRFGAAMGKYGAEVGRVAETQVAKIKAELVKDGVIQPGDDPNINTNGDEDDENRVIRVDGKPLPDHLQPKYRKLLKELDAAIQAVKVPDFAGFGEDGDFDGRD